jgi:hypothetical protein
MSSLSEYRSFFNEIIEAINSAKYKTYKSINKFHIEHNFEIGKIIVENQKKHKKQMLTKAISNADDSKN